MSDVILEDYMFLCSAKDYAGIECRVSLSPTTITVTPIKEQFAKKEKNLNLEDVIGCLCMKHQQSNETGVHRNQSQYITCVFLNVYSYVLSKSLKNLKRKRDTLLLRYVKHSSFEENSADIAR